MGASRAHLGLWGRHRKIDPQARRTELITSAFCRCKQDTRVICVEFRGGSKQPSLCGHYQSGAHRCRSRVSRWVLALCRARRPGHSLGGEAYGYCCCKTRSPPPHPSLAVAHNVHTASVSEFIGSSKIESARRRGEASARRKRVIYLDLLSSTPQRQGSESHAQGCHRSRFRNYIEREPVDVELPDLGICNRDRNSS